jgi:hypothetical protein
MYFSLNYVLLFTAISAAYFDNEDYFYRRNFINHDIGLRARDSIPTRGLPNSRRNIYENKVLLRDLASLRLIARNSPPGSPNSGPVPPFWEGQADWNSLAPVRDPTPPEHNPAGSGPNSAPGSPTSARAPTPPGINLPIPVAGPVAGPGPNSAGSNPSIGPGLYPAGTPSDPGTADTPDPTNPRKNGGKFFCVAPGCKSDYSSREGVIKHFVSIHSRRSRWGCSKCFFYTSAKAKLASHITMYHPAKNVPILRGDGTDFSDTKYIMR